MTELNIRLFFLKSGCSNIRDVLLKILNTIMVKGGPNRLYMTNGMILSENMVRDAIWCFEPNITIGNMVDNPDWIQFTASMPKSVELAEQWIQKTDFSLLDNWVATWSIHET